jgi:nucleoside-diphosphate-sugar epimerase
MVLVTGANGLIGTEVCQVLSGLGVEYLGVSRMKADNHPSHVCCDLTQDNAIQALSKKNFTCIVHLAAMLPSNHVQESVAYEVNKRIDENVAILAKFNNSRVVYCSGTSVYGWKGLLDANEETPVSQSLSPYIKGKAEGELLFSSLQGNNIVLRVSAPYHSRQHTQTVLKIFIDRATSGQDLFLHGTGTRMQDFIHVRDVGRLIGEVVLSDHQGTYNVASGNPISMLNLANMIVRNVPCTSSRVLFSGREDGQEEFRASYSIAKTELELGWHPTIALETGVREWIKSLTV